MIQLLERLAEANDHLTGSKSHHDTIREAIDVIAGLGTTTLRDGKYQVINHGDGRLEALRYGEPWRDLTGDHLVAALVERVTEAESKALPDVDTLAQIIRAVDGRHALGAGALAEAILERLAAR